MDTNTRLSLHHNLNTLKKSRAITQSRSADQKVSKCLTALSPLAYLADLLDYALRHIKKEDQWLTLTDLENYFHQPFGKIPLNCEAEREEVAQIRICIEVLRSHLQEQTSEDAFKTAEREYLKRTYTTLLLKLRISYTTLANIVDATPVDRKALASRLGIAENHLNAVWKAETELTEAWLEEIFGLKNTQAVTFSSIEPSILIWQKEHLVNQADELYDAEQEKERAQWIEDNEKRLTEKLQRITREVEEQTLPRLRKAFLPDEKAARSMSSRLLINCEYDSCFRTSRVSQAVTTLQQLITSIRNGIMQDTHPELALVAPQFADEWKWLGTYQTWRSAMMAFLYPENLLDPNLNRSYSPAFEQLLQKIRKYRSLDRVAADLFVEQYESYFRDISDLQVQATCTSSYNDEIDKSVFFQFGMANGKLFMSELTGSRQSSWVSVPEINREVDVNGKKLQHKGVRQIIGALPFTTSRKERTICLFLRIREGLRSEDSSDINSGPDVLYLMVYNLGLKRWKDESVQLPKPPEGAGQIKLQRGVDIDTPVLYAKTYNKIFRNEINDRLTGLKYAEWESHVLPNYLQGATSYEAFRWGFLFSKSGTVQLVRVQTEYGWSTRKTDIVYRDYESLGVVFYSKFDFYWILRSTRADEVYGVPISWQNNLQAGALKPLKSEEQDQPFLNFDNIANHTDAPEFVSDKGFRIVYEQVFEKERIFYVNAFFAPHGADLLMRDIRKTNLPAQNFDLKPTDSKSRKANIELAFSGLLIWSGHDHFLSDMLWEAYYFLPMTLALQLHRNGYFNDAKDYFRATYDFGLPPTERKIFLGLQHEETIPENFNRYQNWLSDPLNPHAIAQNRQNAYTEFTITSIARCLLKEADDAFSRDTLETLDKARNLYLEVLGLLDGLQTDATAIEDGALEQSFPNPAETLAEILDNGSTEEDQSALTNFFLESSLLKINSFTFEVPINPVWELLKSHAEANLFKLNTCRNISGEERPLGSISMLNNISSDYLRYTNGRIDFASATKTFQPTPFRYHMLIERAKQLINLAQQLENSFLNTLEKFDAEQFSLLNTQNEIQLTQASVRLQDLRLREANSNVNLTQLQKQKYDVQKNHYEDLITTGLLESEKKAMKGLRLNQQMETATNIIGGIAALSNPVTAVGGILSIGKGLSSLFGGGGTNVEIYKTKASYERRAQGWQHQLELAQQDILINAQQELIAKDQVEIVNQELNIASLRSDQAQTIAEFLTNKFTSAELYDWMSEILEGVYSYFLQQATATAQLAAQQLNFERQQPVPAFILSNYWEAPRAQFALSEGDEKDRRGLTGSARLLQDIYQLDQFALQTDRRKLQMTKTISLASISSVEFQQFRQTGKLPFYTLMEHFDRDFPGQYLRLIKRVRVSVIALAPAIEGIKAVLSSNGISRVVQPVLSDFDTTVVRRMPESIALTGTLNASGVFDFEPTDQSKLRPFESMGVDTAWEFALPKATNVSLDYDTIADVLITIDYTALHSEDYKNRVIQELGTSFSADRAFSFRNDFPDQWYDLHHPELLAEEDQLTVHFEILPDDFPPNLTDVKVKHVTLFLPQDDYGDMAISLNRQGKAYPHSSRMTPEGITSTRQAGNSVGRWQPLLGRAPEGTWTLSFPNNEAVRGWFKAGRFRDIILLITYEGELIWD